LLDAEELDNTAAYEVPILIQSGIVTRILVTSTDVLHSVGIPSFGLKLDSVPGRLNRTSVEANFPGQFIGSCYELCGRGHRVIPLHALVV
jgi:cytochrome c oxidase subunit 2